LCKPAQGGIGDADQLREAEGCFGYGELLVHNLDRGLQVPVVQAKAPTASDEVDSTQVLALPGSYVE
jgi:hypothetical protein